MIDTVQISNETKKIKIDIFLNALKLPFEIVNAMNLINKKEINTRMLLSIKNKIELKHINKIILIFVLDDEPNMRAIAIPSELNKDIQ